MVEAVHKFKLKKEDNVQIITGKDKGKKGRVIRILRDKDRIIVEGINLVKKAKKRRKQNDRGGIVEIEAAIHSSNVMLVCKKCGPVRTGYKFEGDKKIRVCRKCGEAV